MNLKRTLDEMDAALAAGVATYLAKYARVESESEEGPPSQAGGDPGEGAPPLRAGDGSEEAEPEEVEPFEDAPGFYAAAEPHLLPLLHDMNYVLALEYPDPRQAEATGRLMAAARAHLAAAHVVLRNLPCGYRSGDALHAVATELLDDAEPLSSVAMDPDYERLDLDLPFHAQGNTE